MRMSQPTGDTERTEEKKEKKNATMQTYGFGKWCKFMFRMAEGHGTWGLLGVLGNLRRALEFPDGDIPNRPYHTRKGAHLQLSAPRNPRNGT